MRDSIGDDMVYFEGKDVPHDYLVFPWAQPAYTETLQAIGKWTAKL